MNKPMRSGILLFFTFLILIFQGATQTMNKPLASSYLGWGAYSTNRVDVFSGLSNPAAYGSIRNTAVGVFGERRFLLNELAGYHARMAVPVSGAGTFGASALYNGNTNFNQSHFGFSYGRNLGQKLSVGATFNYNNMQIAGYGSANAIGFDIGTILHINDKLHAGVRASNPVGGEFSNKQGEQLPAVYSGGLGYEASDKLFISAELEKEEDQPLSVNAGLQYNIIKAVQLKLGMYSATSTAWLGIGFTADKFRAEIITGFHQQLGITPGLSFLYQFNNKKD